MLKVGRATDKVWAMQDLYTCIYAYVVYMKLNIKSMNPADPSHKSQENVSKASLC